MRQELAHDWLSATNRTKIGNQSSQVTQDSQIIHGSARKTCRPSVFGPNICWDFLYFMSQCPGYVFEMHKYFVDTLDMFNTDTLLGSKIRMLWRCQKLKFNCSLATLIHCFVLIPSMAVVPSIPPVEKTSNEVAQSMPWMLRLWTLLLTCEKTAYTLFCFYDSIVPVQ